MNKKRKGGLKQTLKSKMSTCHPDKPVQARRLCKNCYDKWLKKNNPEYAKKQKQNCLEWTKKHIEDVKKYKKEYRAKQDPEWNRARGLKYNFGITPDEYDMLLRQQDGKCAICGKLPKKSGKRLSVDHDHNTGVIRGLLCFRCNFGLSYFSEDFNIMKKAYLYLKDGEKRGKEFEEMILQRKSEEKVEEKRWQQKKEKMFANAKTKEISKEDKKEIITLYNGKNKKLADICNVFPQYSKSSIHRTLKSMYIKETKK